MLYVFRVAPYQPQSMDVLFTAHHVHAYNPRAGLVVFATFENLQFDAEPFFAALKKLQK